VRQSHADTSDPDGENGNCYLGSPNEQEYVLIFLVNGSIPSWQDRDGRREGGRRELFIFLHESNFRCAEVVCLITPDPNLIARGRSPFPGASPTQRTPRRHMELCNMLISSMIDDRFLPVHTANAPTFLHLSRKGKIKWRT